MPAWETELRSLFPALRLGTYLDSAATGPIAMETARAGFEVYESLLQGGGNDWARHLRGVEDARLALAALCGATPEELAFTRNTSHGVGLAAQMLWDEGRRTAVALEDEFPASTIPFLHRGFDIHFVRPAHGLYRMDEIAAALKGRDVLISSQVLYRTGQSLDTAALGAMARDAGAAFLLCVTQALGAMQVDFAASGADFLVGTSHKWLCAGYGAGLLAVRADRHATTRWPQVGWLSQKNPMQMRAEVLDLENLPRVMEAGAHPTPCLWAAGAAARIWLRTGPERIQQRVRALTAELRARLRTAGFDAPEWPEEALSGITVVPVEDPHTAVERLTAQGVSTTPRGKGVRFGVHAFNDTRDLERGVAALVAATS